MKIYTKTGDKGETGIIGGRISKDSVVTECLGNFDELNSSIGVLKENLKIEDKPDIQDLARIQNLIFNIGSIIGGSSDNTDFKKHTQFLETQIDIMNSELSELTQFILPGGCLLNAHSHVCRTICRRAERSLVRYINFIDDTKLYKSNLDKSKLKTVLQFTNRLSDYFFVFARYLNKKSNNEDVYWNKAID